jgi:hypothetical protein
VEEDESGRGKVCGIMWVCQQVKGEHKHPVGELQSLEVPV